MSRTAWEGSAAALSDALRDAGPDKGDGLRGGVVEQVETLVVQWVAKVGVAEGLSEEQAVAASAKLLLLGSYALGALLPGADVDVAAVVPYFVERRHFFEDGGLGGTLLGLLRAQPDLTGLQPLPPDPNPTPDPDPNPNPDLNLNPYPGQACSRCRTRSCR